MQQDDDLGVGALNGGIGVTAFAGVNSSGIFRASVESKPFAAAAQQAQATAAAHPSHNHPLTSATSSGPSPAGSRHSFAISYSSAWLLSEQHGILSYQLTFPIGGAARHVGADGNAVTQCS